MSYVRFLDTKEGVEPALEKNLLAEWVGDEEGSQKSRWLRWAADPKRSTKTKLSPSDSSLDLQTHHSWVFREQEYVCSNC